MKIAVIGYSGAGKSTLAGELGKRYSLPVLHLDTVEFLPGWQERDPEEGRELVREFMSRPGWVIDGNYKKFLRERRMQEADWIVFLNFPRRVCLRQAFSRYLQNRGRTRESMAEECPEKFDLEFIRWILFEGRTRRVRQEYREICEKYRGKTRVCRSRREVRALLQNGLQAFPRTD